MKAYHIDRMNTLNVGDTIRLQKNIIKQQPLIQNIIDEIYPDGLSQYGSLMFAATNPESLETRIMENIYEYERQLVFPNAPSRFQSIFATKTLSEMSKWSELIKANGCKVYEIEFEHNDYIERDSHFLTSSINNYSPVVTRHYSLEYWKGSKTNNPMMELLIKLPVKVIKEVKLY